MDEIDMGTRQEADARFLAACDAWIEARRPRMIPAPASRRWDKIESEARFDLVNAALHLAWHMRAARDAARAALKDGHEP